jgi:hypothetical protein
MFRTAAARSVSCKPVTAVALGGRPPGLGYPAGAALADVVGREASDATTWETVAPEEPEARRGVLSLRPAISNAAVKPR